MDEVVRNAVDVPRDRYCIEPAENERQPQRAAFEADNQIDIEEKVSDGCQNRRYIPPCVSEEFHNPVAPTQATPAVMNSTPAAWRRLICS
ncbi:hypothetical protein NZA98_04600, partial [Escherichia coli]|nr:hypothetical protein [Escherichia coli]